MHCQRDNTVSTNLNSLHDLRPGNGQNLYLALSSQRSPWECWWQEPTRPGSPPDPQQRKARPLSAPGMVRHLGPHNHKQPQREKEKIHETKQ